MKVIFNFGDVFLICINNPELVTFGMHVALGFFFRYHLLSDAFLFSLGLWNQDLRGFAPQKLDSWKMLNENKNLKKRCDWGRYPLFLDKPLFLHCLVLVLFLDLLFGEQPLRTALSVLFVFPTLLKGFEFQCLIFALKILWVMNLFCTSCTTRF